MRWQWFLLAVGLLPCTWACQDAAPRGGGSGGGGELTGAGTGGRAGGGALTGGGESAGGATSGGTNTGGTALALGGSAGGIPLPTAELLAFLEARQYRWFAHQEAPFQTSSHGLSQVYVNPILETSLAGSVEVHPVGAAAIREIHDAERPGTLRGWGVTVKLTDASHLGDGWYYFELDRLWGDTTPSFAGVGIPYCRSCHMSVPDVVQGKYQFVPSVPPGGGGSAGSSAGASSAPADGGRGGAGP